MDRLGSSRKQPYGGKSSSQGQTIPHAEIANTESPPGSKDFPIHPVRHPFLIRIKDSEGFSVSTPESLIGAGFASLSVAVFSLFRPTRGLLIVFTKPSEHIWDTGIIDRTVIWAILWLWSTIVFSVLVILGLTLVGSMHIKKRWILVLHPWGLLLLYLDLFVWLSLTITVHIKLETWPIGISTNPETMHSPLAYFIIMYIECASYAALYYWYATYFIVAELTIIEKFFP